MTSDTPMATRPHGCSISGCRMRFERAADLKRHTNVHLNHRPHICKVCHKAFSQKSGLTVHMNKHTGAKPFSCGHHSCRSTFGDPSSAARHRREKHESLGAYTCPDVDCVSRIKRRSAFILHLVRKHQIDIKAFDVDSCAPVKRASAKVRMSDIEAPIIFETMDTKFSVEVPSQYYAQAEPVIYHESTPEYTAEPYNHDLYAQQSFTSYAQSMYPNEALYTLDAQQCTPPLTYSASRSPSPSMNFDGMWQLSSADISHVDNSLSKLQLDFMDGPAYGYGYPEQDSYRECIDSYFMPQRA